MPNQIFRTDSAYDYPLLIKQLFLAPGADNPEQEIVYRGEKRFTYRQFRERVARLATALTGMGVKAGDTVAVMDWDSNRYLECYFAIPMIGAVIHHVNIRFSPEQLVYTIDHAEDDMIIVNAEFLPLLEQIKGRIDTVKKYILIDEGSSAANAQPAGIPIAGEYEKMIAAAKPMEEFPDFDENTRATTFYTTGTTGMAKGVYFSHRQLVLHTMATMAALGAPKAQGRFHQEDVYMPITPMFHVHAWGIPFIAYMLGVKQVYPGKYIPSVLLKLIDEEKVTFSHCVPTILHMLLKDPSAEKIDLSKWKCIIGGAALPRAVAIAALKKGIDVFVGYGMSETCPVLTLSHLTENELKLSVEEQAELRCRTGRPLPLVQMRVVDEKGNAIKTDDKATGEIIVRTPWLTQGYLKDHSNSERLWAGGWLHTNDISAVKANGSVRITDRKKDLIKIGGEWLSSLEIEDILCTHPAVAEAAVIGQPDLKWGEIPLALIVLKKDHTSEEKDIIAHTKSSVDNGVLPREAILLKAKFVAAIDKTSVGKINKVELRKKYLTAL